jgi:(d)CTP diphosphatase
MSLGAAPSRNNRRGAVAVVVRDNRLLVIRRSAHVVAPRAFCFPGGAIEPGETEVQALVREFHEELDATIQPIARVWQSVTPWDVELAWWLGHLEPESELSPNPAEVESIHWLTPDEMLAESQLLESNRRFLAELAAGRIELAGAGL